MDPADPVFPIVGSVAWLVAGQPEALDEAKRRGEEPPSASQDGADDTGNA